MRKKNSRLRGSKTHGWGSMKKHRGAGNRGGRGMAGTGKRGDAKKPVIWKDNKYFGKHGFKSIHKKSPSVNLSYIDGHVEMLIKDKKAKKDGEFIVIDLGKTKLLGTGKITNKFKITCDTASAKAIAKVEAIGGKVTINNVAEEHPAESA